MEKSNNIIRRIICVVLALTLTACIFTSCKKNNEEEEITRGNAQIERPTYEEESQPEGEATTDPAATMEDARNTTAKTSDNATTEGTTYSSDPKVDDAIKDAANQSGMSPEQIAEFIQIMGYDYDPVQGIFYTSLDNWQRQANFVAHYDTAAHYFNMNYRTARIDFGPIDGLDWRIQLWKGQYGAFGGSEIGVYTKDPKQNAMLYHCADDEHLLYMESALYLNKEDYQNNKIYFTREWQKHWWLTGFKPGVVNPTSLIMSMRIRCKSDKMAEQFAAALEKAGFTPVNSSKEMGYNTYRRSLNDIFILWDDVGELNYVQKKN